MIEGLVILSITVAITAFGTLLATRLQQNNWRHQHRISIEDAQLKRAQELSDAIVLAFDMRAYALRRFMWAVQSPSRFDQAEAVASYKQAIIHWNHQFGYFRANLLSLYDWYEVKEFEEEIHKRLQELGTLTEGHLNGTGSVNFHDSHKKLSQLSVYCYQYINHLQKPIRARSLPRFDKIDELSFHNADNLDSIYLIKRLYGVLP